MSGNNIIHFNVDNSNLSSTSKTVSFNIINSIPVVSNSNDYEIFIEKCEIPISKNLPLIVSVRDVKITLEATDKDDKDPIFGLGLFHTTTISRQFKNLQQILNEINNVIYNQLGPTFQWCRLSTTDGKTITMTVTNAARSEKTKIWIDGMFFNLFNELPVTNDGFIYQEFEYFQLDNPKPIDNVYTQDESYTSDVFNLKAFRLRSSLPTEPWWLYDQTKGTMEPSDLLGDIIYNNKEMIGNANELYTPFNMRKCSLTDAGPISNFTLRVFAYYFNGIEIPIALERDAYFFIALCFERKFKI